MSRNVKVIRACKVSQYKMPYHRDKFLHIGAVTIVSNRDHMLHYAIEEEMNFLNQFCSWLLRSMVVIISKGLFLYKRHEKRFKLHGVFLSSVADLDRTQQTIIERADNRDRSEITVTYLSTSMTHPLTTTTACYGYRITT